MPRTSYRPGWIAAAFGAALSACGGEVPAADDASPDVVDAAELAPFSFFVTSLLAMRELSGSEDGFGGDLGGLDGADAICQQIAAGQGFGGKSWRAFLSVTSGTDGAPVHAIDRIGDGPWYDRNGRLVAEDIAGLTGTRPAGDPQIANDLPDEYGIGLLAQFGDAHDVMTGSDELGRLSSMEPRSTCHDWTSAGGTDTENIVRVGHTWPRMPDQSWIDAHQMPGCEPGVVLEIMTPPGPCVGCQGGWGGIYCFALTP